MTEPTRVSGSPESAGWADVALVVELFAVCPASLGGIVLRSGPGEARDLVSGWIAESQPASAPRLRVPSHITDDGLLGGVSIAASMRSGRLVAEPGLLARAHGGVVILAMAERLEANIAALVCSALDRGEVPRSGSASAGTAASRFGVVALDEGIDDERVPESLADRLALRIDLTPLVARVGAGVGPSRARIGAAQALFAGVSMDARLLEPLTIAALSVGVASLRAVVFAAVAARAHAALRGSTRVEEADVVVAARLIFGPRATSLPAETAPPADDAPREASTEGDEPDPPPPRDAADEGAADHGEADPTLEEVVVQAAKSGVPAGLLELLARPRGPRTLRRTQGHAGEARTSTAGGRPAGTRAAAPRPGEKLNLIETLRAAAPWQPLRARERAGSTTNAGPRVLVRKEDFRVSTFKRRSETCVIFSVDASGSLALRRLGDAKGAVEQVLADCYVRRDHVALIAFRGPGASVLLPPTRSLARVRRGLADLAGGGATPLAAGIDAAMTLALATRKAGRTPILVLMTDGRANVARDGSTGGPVPAGEAIASAQAVRVAGVRALFLDTAPRPRAEARTLAREMGARYVALPYLDAAGISRQVQALRGEP